MKDASERNFRTFRLIGICTARGAKVGSTRVRLNDICMTCSCHDAENSLFKMTAGPCVTASWTSREALLSDPGTHSHDFDTPRLTTRTRPQSLLSTDMSVKQLSLSLCSVVNVPTRARRLWAATKPSKIARSSEKNKLCLCSDTKRTKFSEGLGA